MATFSSTEAAFSGFRFIGRRPKTVLIWAGIYLVYQLVFGAIVVSLQSDKLTAMLETNRTDPLGALAMLPGLGPLFLVALLLTFTLWSVLSEAVFRALLGGEGAPAYIRFGRDELRMGALILAWSALFLGYTFLLVFVAALVSAPAVALPMLLRPLYLFVVACAAVVAFVYPTVRLSLSFPMTVATNHVRIFESWRLTKGRFWPLLGGYILSWLLIMVVQLVALIVIVAVAAAVLLGTGGSFASLSGVFQPDYTSIAAYYTPARMIAILLDAPVSAAVLTIGAGPSAYAYMALAAEAAPHLAEQHHRHWWWLPHGFGHHAPPPAAGESAQATDSEARPPADGQGGPDGEPR